MSAFPYQTLIASLLHKYASGGSGRRGERIVLPISVFAHHWRPVALTAAPVSRILNVDTWLR